LLVFSNFYSEDLDDDDEDDDDDDFHFREIRDLVGRSIKVT